MNKEEALSEPNMIPIKLEKRYPESKDEDITDAFMQGYLKGKADRPKGEWIPCSERLPSEGEVVLASWSCLWKDAIVLARRYEGKWEWAYEHGTDYWQPTELEEYWPEAWQPLPAPYKGGDAE